MYIENVTLKSVPADSLILPVEEGTILTKNGTIPADLSQAYGIVPQKITNIPPTKKIYLAVAGTIDLKLNNVSFTEEEMQALGKDFNFVPGDEGGGNPNRVEVIQGTLDNPWGDVGFDLLASSIYDPFSREIETPATAILMFNAAVLGYDTDFYTVLHRVTDGVIGTDNSNLGADSGLASHMIWSTDGLLSAFLLTYEGTTATVSQLSEYGSLIPTTLTIIWHPLPGQS